MEEEINEPRKECPVCEKKYAGGDNFCPNDGAKLVVAGTTVAPVRDTDPGLQPQSGKPVENKE